MKYRFFCLFMLLAVSTLAFGQNNCTYRIELFDMMGDGWSTSVLEVGVNDGPIQTFTLDRENDNGVFTLFDINITDGDSLTINYVVNSNRENEHSYRLISPEDILIFEDGVGEGNRPTEGIVFAQRLECPTCLVVNPNSVSIDDVSSTFATLSWAPRIDQNSSYQIEIGDSGFEPGQGTTVETPNSFVTLEGLIENTAYDVYIMVDCGVEEESRSVGPYSFVTRFNKDVGVIRVVAPETACAIFASDSIKVELANFGGLPQSLIPFNFSINDNLGGVSMPNDGLYTGVLGKDSTDIIAFDVPFGTSTPGEYTIKAWTEFEDDSFMQNDTFTTTITNIPVIRTYPYEEGFEEWKGGWLIGEGSRNASWEYGMLFNIGINAAANGSFAWVTNLDGDYNSEEFSTLVSPCLDFSNLNQDPRFSMSLNFRSESCCDEAWVELSIDGGETWEKVGNAETGFNWYNNSEENWWSGDGGFNGWVTAFSTLTGSAGQPDVRVRIVFSSDAATMNEEMGVDEGMGIDDIFIGPINRDLGGKSLARINSDECGINNDGLIFTVENFGEMSEENILVNYQINGGEVISENLSTNTLASGQEFVHTFSGRF